MTPEQVGAGIVTGGWTFVTVSYALSWVLLVGYAASLWRRGRVLVDKPEDPS